MHILGAVENKTSDWIGNVIVHLTLYDQNGQQLNATSTLGDAEQAASAENDAIPPGGMAYYEYLRDVEKIEGEFDHYDLSVTYSPVDPPYRVTADIANLQVGDMNDLMIEVSGQVVNNSDKDCLRPAAIVLGYDASGLLYEIEPYYLETDPLPAGDKGDFQTLIYNPNQTLKDIKAIASCASWD